MSITVNQIYDNPSILTNQESNLVVSKEMTRFFGLPEDFIQLYIYNNLDTLVGSNINFQDYTVTDNKEVSFDPAVDIENLGFRLGTYRMVYNFFRPILTQNSNLDLFIKSISSDRKEIKISTTIDQNALFNNTVAYIDLVQNRNYFIEYYLDFGSNNLQTGLSIAVEKDIDENVFVILKLQNSLPNNITVNTPLNIVEKIVNTQEFQTVLTSDITPIQNTLPSLREANFSIETDNQFIGSSDYYNYNQIITYTGSQFQNVLNYISSSNPTINVDYTDYNNFVHFASAYQKLETFKDQLTKIESYQTYLNSITPSNPDYVIYIGKIDSILQGFDGYENYLYYESSSYAWPKQNTTKPYINYSVTSSQSLNWYGSSNLSSPYYGGQVVSSSIYDEFNNNNLIYGLPIYIQERDDFENVKLFINSIGQMFDDIWIYIKAMTDLWKAENKLTEGISKDLVADALKSLGIKLYTDGDQDDLYTYLYGVNSTGSQNFVTQSWQTGVTSSVYTMSGQDEAKSIFKRIYHNLPTLLKSKGTTRFINYLNTLYGIPETILYPIEYGGVDKNTTTSEYNYNKFTYALQFSGSSRFVTFNNSTSSSLNLKTLEFRFKPNVSSSTPQVLISESSGAYSITLETTSSNGYSYGNLKLNSGSYSNFTTLPFYVTSSNDYNWWNIAWTNYNTGSIVYIKSEINGEIGHQGNILCPTAIPDSGSYSIKLGSNFYGQLQEFRGWSEILSESIVSTHTLNPESYVGNTSSSINSLLFRFPLGNDLKLLTTTTTGSQPKLNSNYYLTFTNISQSNYTNFTEKYYSSPAIGGYSTPVTDKIRIVDTSVATTRLQPLKSVVYNPTSSRTLDIHVTQTGFSPQDQINNDIIAQLGTNYNLDDIIGNPKLASLDTYPELDILKENYFSKYNNPYNYKDFINLIETFHKSLFRYLEDYVPGRNNNNSGVVIKSHILERNKVKRYEPTLSTSSYEGEISTVSISGSNPGNYCCTRNSSENEAFYTGELSGSFIDINDYYTQNNPFALLPTQSSLVNFSKQYGGWDALNNNVSSSIQSNVKYKDIYVSKSIDTSALNCIRWKVTRNPVSAINQIMYVNYTACDGNLSCLQLNANGPSYNNTVYDYVVAREDGPPQLSANLGIAPCFNTTNTTPDFFTSSFDSYVVLRDKNIFTHFSKSIEWQDSLLSDSGYVFSREDGVKLTSLNFNEPVINGNIGEITNVEQTTPYMLYFDWAGGTLAERQGSANYHIKFLIDESGSVFKPEYSSSYYYLTDQGFGCNKPVNVSIYNSLGTYNTVETTVYRPLKRFSTILYSDTGSLGTNQLQPGYYTTMSFDSLGGYLTNIETQINFNGDSYNPVDYEAIKYDTILLDNAGGWNPSTYVYTAPGNYQNQVQITASVSFQKYGLSTAQDVVVTLFKNDNVFARLTEDCPGGGTSTIIKVSGSTTYNKDDKFYVTFYSNDTFNRDNFYVVGGFLSITAGPNNIVPVVTSSFFTSSFGGTVLTASTALSYYYGPGYSQTPFDNSGFDNPLSFTIQPYDQIRFGGNENQVYTIMSISFSGSISGSTGNLYLHLDRSPQGQNLNYFSIRRLVSDPGFVILNTTNVEGPGFIIPKYPTSTLSNNLSNIIQDLSAKNLIP